MSPVTRLREEKEHLSHRQGRSPKLKKPGLVVQASSDSDCAGKRGNRLCCIRVQQAYPKIPCVVNGGTRPAAWEGVGMGGHVLALDTILSATFFFVGKWSPDLARNRSRDLLRFVLCRFYDAGRGTVQNAQFTLAQTTLAHKLGLSRQWVGILLARLQEAGWVEFYAPTLPDGTNGSTIFRPGRQLKRLVIALLKSRRAKKPAKPVAQSTWHFSPSAEEKKLNLIRQKEMEPPKPEVLRRMPLLRRWLSRGNSGESQTPQRQ
jgi:hypothetical protein